MIQFVMIYAAEGEKPFYINPEWVQYVVGQNSTSGTEICLGDGSFLKSFENEQIVLLRLRNQHEEYTCANCDLDFFLIRGQAVKCPGCNGDC